jgi:hypothetical protein
VIGVGNLDPYYKERVVVLLQLAQDRTARIEMSTDDIEPASRRW